MYVPDSEEVASGYTPSPRVQPGGPRGTSRGETPPDSRMSNNDEDDIMTGPSDHDPSHYAHPGIHIVWHC